MAVAVVSLANGNNNGGGSNGNQNQSNDCYVNSNVRQNGNGTINSPYQTITQAYEAAKAANHASGIYFIHVAKGTYTGINW